MVCAIYKFFSNNSTTMLNHVKKTLSVGFCFRPSPPLAYGGSAGTSLVAGADAQLHLSFTG